jgi:UTP:GlnB (protein PII) uridylyltransferase
LKVTGPLPSVSPRDIVSAYVVRRLELIGSAEPGTAAARDLSDLTDRAVSAVAETALASLRDPWALVALGGWGAGRLLPGSDLDFLVVTAAPAAELKPALEQVLYPLWDAGLKVGHQVRSRRDHLRSARDDLVTLTATLSGRHLAGDETLSSRLLAETAAGASKQARRLVAGLARRDRPGSPYLLEPDLKEGAGGQRDLDEIAWLAAVLSGAPAVSPEPLVGLGLLSSNEAGRLAAAGDRITAARWSLHRSSTRATSILTLDAADETVATEGLHGALADASHLLLRVRARALGRPLACDGPGAGALAAAGLFALLDQGAEAVIELEDAAWSGCLDDAVPGFADLMTLRRPAIGHLYTVGAHSIRCAALVSDIARRRGGRAGRVLQTAALLHDIGKVQSGPAHPARGAGMLRTVAPRLELDPMEASDAERLVAEHLLLAETSATQDIHDEDVLLRTAAAVGRPDMLEWLYELTEADATATGPGSWTPWHAALVGELADRLAAALSEEVEGAGMADRAEIARTEALALLGPTADGALTAFVSDAHIRYLASQSPSDIVVHARMAADVAASGGREPRTAVSPGPVERTWRVTVAAADRTGLFAAAAGSLALAGLDILSAEAFSAPGDVALDAFIVRPDTLAEAGTSTWSTFDRYLVAAVGGHLDTEARMIERRRHYERPAGAEPTVSVERTGSYATAVYVTASDRVGLLYDLARAIADCGLDIRWARATTRAGLVRDVFHLVDAYGEPVDDPGELGHLAMRMRERASNGTARVDRALPTAPRASSRSRRTPRE